jgi:hypothetical protein
MSSKRRIGVSIASTEAARRQLMQPVQCWEKVWAVPENGPAHLKVYRWVKTEKVQVRTFGDACGLVLNFKPLQQFSDDEDEADVPLAPLPDEPEPVEDEDEQEETQEIPSEPANNLAEPTAIQDTQDDVDASKPPSPKADLTMSLNNEDLSELNVDPNTDTLDASLNPMEPTLSVQDSMVPDQDIGLDIVGLGPDGLPLESTGDLTQIQPTDALVGGHAMDQSLDPFTTNNE